MNLKIGKEYQYWSKSIYENKASLKRCKLIYISSNKRFARVRRYDLEVNQIQIVETKRLQEIPQPKFEERKLF